MAKEMSKMKPQWNKKHATIALYSAAVLILSILTVFLFLKFDEVRKTISGFFAICAPIIYGAFLAYILNPLLRLYESKLFPERRPSGLSRRARRIISVVLTMLTFFLILALFVWMILPQLVASVKDLGERLPDYLKSVNELADSLAQKGGILSGVVNTLLERVNELIDSSYDLLNEYLPKITEFIQSVAAAVFIILLALLFAVYFLCAKERISSQAKKIARALFNDKHYASLQNILSLADKTFGRYFTGAILDSFIVGAVCFLMMTVFRMPYAPLISAVIGVTNIIPIFGPFLGAIPSALILFVYKPIFAVYFALMILVLQQVDGNIIAPRIHGASTGLAPVWVIVSITIMSGLFGAIGMFIGVPVFSVIYFLIKQKVEQRLSDKAAPTESMDYMNESGRKLNEPKPADDRTEKEKFLSFFKAIGRKFKKKKK